MEKIGSALSGNKLDAVICVAGGWAGGNAAKDLTKNTELMWKQSMWSSLISASLAASHLKEGGLITLTGAKAALEPTPGIKNIHTLYYYLFMTLICMSCYCVHV